MTLCAQALKKRVKPFVPVEKQIIKKTNKQNKKDLMNRPSQKVDQSSTTPKFPCCVRFKDEICIHHFPALYRLTLLDDYNSLTALFYDLILVKLNLALFITGGLFVCRRHLKRGVWFSSAPRAVTMLSWMTNSWQPYCCFFSDGWHRIYLINAGMHNSTCHVDLISSVLWKPPLSYCHN